MTEKHKCDHGMPSGCASEFATLKAIGRTTEAQLGAIFKMLNGNGQPGLLHRLTKLEVESEENTHSRHGWVNVALLVVAVLAIVASCIISLL